MCQPGTRRVQLQQRVTVWPEAGSPWRSDTGAPRFLWPQMEPLGRAASAAAPAPDRGGRSSSGHRWRWCVYGANIRYRHLVAGAAHYAYRGQNKTSHALKGLRNENIIIRDIVLSD